MSRLHPLISSNTRYNLIFTVETTLSCFMCISFQNLIFLLPKFNPLGLTRSVKLLPTWWTEDEIVYFPHFTEVKGLRFILTSSLLRRIQKSVVKIENCGYIFVLQTAYQV